LGASVVGVVGAGGGAGASTVAAGLAAANARRGRRSLLVDADPLGGGIDLLMGCEGVPGLRWPDIEIDGGRVAAGSLLAALPSVGGVSVLSASAASGAELNATALHAMIEAGRRASRLVVVDLPRHVDAVTGTRSSDLDAILIVATTTVRSIASGRQVAAAAARACSDVRVVVRTTRGRSIEPDAVAESLGVGLAGIVPTLGAVTRAADDGDGVARGWRARRCYDLLLAQVGATWASR
jgi:secretion/DNA translocation related CpaE-like protein